MKEFTITTEGVRKLLQNLNTDKAPGPDGLTPQLLKSVAEEVEPILKSSSNAVYIQENFLKIGDTRI